MAQDTVIARDSSDEEEERGCKLPEAHCGILGSVSTGAREEGHFSSPASRL